MCDSACTAAIQALTASVDTFNTQFAWDQSAFDLALSGMFLMWAIGLGVGLVVAQVRKARSP